MKILVTLIMLPQAKEREFSVVLHLQLNHKIYCKCRNKNNRNLA